jgi:hypothetical protein
VSLAGHREVRSPAPHIGRKNIRVKYKMKITVNLMSLLFLSRRGSTALSYRLAARRRCSLNRLPEFYRLRAGTISSSGGGASTLGSKGGKFPIGSTYT